MSASPTDHKGAYTVTPATPRNSWSRSEVPRTESVTRPDSPAAPEVAWQLRTLSAVDSGDLFQNASGNALIRLLAFFAKRKMPALILGALLLCAAVYFLMVPTGTTLAGLPAAYLTMVLAACAVGLASLVTLGAWLRPVESVEDAVAIMTVPLIAMDKGVLSDVH
jgi:hypothetical protein